MKIILVIYILRNDSWYVLNTIGYNTLTFINNYELIKFTK